MTFELRWKMYIEPFIDEPWFHIKYRPLGEWSWNTRKVSLCGHKGFMGEDAVLQTFEKINREYDGNIEKYVKSIAVELLKQEIITLTDREKYISFYNSIVMQNRKWNYMTVEVHNE